MSIDNFDLRLLRVFDALMTEQSVTQAAARLHLTQSAVSQALAKLRETLGDPLFVRTGHAMAPTARALAMSEPIRQSLTMMSAALDAYTTFDPATARRSFRVATTDYTLMMLLPKLAKKVAETAPGVELFISSVNLDRGIESIRDGKVDLLIAYFVVTKIPPNFRTRQLFRDSYVVLARKAHPLFRSGMQLSSFVEADHIVVAPRDTWHPGPLDWALSRLGLRRKIRILVPHYMLVPDVVAESDLIATIPARAAAEFKRRASINTLPLPVDLASFRVEMAWNERRHHDPAHKWMRELFIEISKTLPAV